MRSADPTAPMAEGSSEASGDYRYFVGRIARSTTQRELEQYFGNFGDVVSITLKRDASGNLRGYGWVQYRAPPESLLRPEPHILRGSVLTVEPARSRGPIGNPRQERRGGDSDRHATRRRRRSYSLSRTSSQSSTFSSSSGRRNSHNFFPSGPNLSGNNAPLPSISVGNCRLPPLMGKIFPTATNVHAPASATLGYDNAGHTGSNQNSAMSVSETYLCIPTTLCPVEYINDPRTFFAKLDPNRVGSLNIVPAPFLTTNSTSSVNSVQHAPPPPPPPSGTLLHSGQLGNLGMNSALGMMSSASAIQTERGGMGRMGPN